MEVQLSKEQTDFIKKIAKEEGFENYELKTALGSSKGDNYMGIITAISLQDAQKRLQLILKTSSDNNELRKRFPLRKTFLNEIFVYKTVFPLFKRFQEDQGHLEGFSGYAKLYGACEDDWNEFLLFENQKTKGYELWNRKIPMTADHVSLVLKEYGKLHAVSFALKEKRPEEFEAVSKKMENVFLSIGSDELSALLKTALQNGFSAIRSDRLATEAFERFAFVVKTFLLEDLVPDENSVILHGDCWCNNLLFKYQDSRNEKPSKVCLLDWQLSWVGSPALDLANFLLTCSSKEVLSDFKYYLRIYHNSLKNSLKRMNCDPETLFPFSLLERHWQKYVKYGIYLALNLLRLCLLEENEVLERTKLGESVASLSESFSFEITNNDTYNRRIMDIVRLSAENNWI